MVVNNSDSQNKRSYNDIYTAVLKVTDYGPVKLNRSQRGHLSIFLFFPKLHFMSLTIIQAIHLDFGHNKGSIAN